MCIFVLMCVSGEATLTFSTLFLEVNRFFYVKKKKKKKDLILEEIYFLGNHIGWKSRNFFLFMKIAKMCGESVSVIPKLKDTFRNKCM